MEGEIYGARTHTHTHSSNISAMHQLLQGAYLGMIHRLPAAASDLGVEAGAGRLRRLVLVAVAAASRDFFVCSRKKLSKKKKKTKKAAAETGTGRAGVSEYGSRGCSALDGRCQRRPERGKANVRPRIFKIKGLSGGLVQ